MFASFTVYFSVTEPMDNTNPAHDAANSPTTGFLGAVHFAQDEPVDLVLEAVVRQLKADGFRIAGYL